MTRKHVCFVLALICASFLTACHKVGIVDPDPIPDQSKYETLPATHRLLDVAGNPTKMYAIFNTVSPARGSAITLTPPSAGSLGVCTSCFQYSLTVGFDGTVNPSVVATFKVGLSVDNTTIIYNLDSYAIRGQGTASSDSNLIAIFPQAPISSLVILGSYPGDTNGPFGSFPGGVGIANFLLAYVKKV